jgi:prepilin-type N-terminal cleavage/methylation domain-containing protein
MDKHGYSLIELIVVITIIAVITAIGMISYGGANRKARDGRRVADLEKVRVALEMARQVGGTYPSSLSTLVTPMNLMGATATDPKTGTGYSYTRGGTMYTYTLDAVVEDLGSTNMAGMIYRVTNP